MQRADDSDGVVRERLKVYQRQTQPLVEYYSGAADVPDDRRQPAAGRGDGGDRTRRSARRRVGAAGGAAVIVCRSPAEIEKMRAANQLVARVLAELRGDGGAGRDDGGPRRAGGASWCATAGAEPAFKGYRGYPATLCASVNEQVVHGIPSARAAASRATSSRSTWA